MIIYPQEIFDSLQTGYQQFMIQLGQVRILSGKWRKNWFRMLVFMNNWTFFRWKELQVGKNTLGECYIDIVFLILKRFYEIGNKSLIMANAQQSICKTYMAKQYLAILLLAIQLSLALDYDPTLSQQYQRYSIITHCTQQELASWSCNACQSIQKLQNFIYLQNKVASIMAYMGYSRSLDKIMIVFRGTVDAKNWVEDFSFYQVRYERCKNCKIHEGFYLSYLAISQQVYAGIDSLQKIYKGKQILVIGSSLGATLAMTGALEIQMKYQSVSQLHTFGCPRLGNQQLAMFVKTRLPKVIRVVHNRDIVPHVPLLSQNFTHPPFEVLYDEGMTSYKICAEGGEDPQCSDSYYPNFSIQDHVSYWTKLNVHDICS